MISILVDRKKIEKGGLRVQVTHDNSINILYFEIDDDKRGRIDWDCGIGQEDENYLNRAFDDFMSRVFDVIDAYGDKTGVIAKYRSLEERESVANTDGMDW